LTVAAGNDNSLVVQGPALDCRALRTAASRLTPLLLQVKMRRLAVIAATAPLIEIQKRDG
jgi:hypothetical protein